MEIDTPSQTMASSSSRWAMPPAWPGYCRRARSDGNAIVIDGLKLTMTGLELKEKLEARIAWHTTQAADSARLLRAPDPTERCALPEAVLERDIRHAQSQIETLTLIRNYIIVDELYRLSVLTCALPTCYRRSTGSTATASTSRRGGRRSQDCSMRRASTTPATDRVDVH